MKKKIKFAIWGATVLMAGLFSCFLFVHGKDPNSPKLPGEKFVVAYEPYAPYLWEDNGTPRGFDYDLACEVAKRNNWEMETRLIRWGERDRYLNSGEVDVLWNGMKATPERREKYECGANYLSSGDTVTVSVKSGISKLEDLTGKRIAIQSMTPISREFLSGDYRVQGGNSHLLPLPDFPDMRNAFENGEADALITDYHVAQYLWGKNPDFRIIPNFLYETENIFAVKKGRIAFRDQIQNTLQKLADDGTFQKIRKKWFGDAPAPVRDTAVFKNKKILVIHSGNVYFPKSKLLFDGFSNYLASKKRSVRYDIHGLDTLTRNVVEATSKDYYVIQKIINEGKYDLILVNNNPATDPFLTGKITVPDGTPVLCMSYHGDLAGKIRPGLNMTGIVTPSTAVDNITLAVRLRPNAGKIIVLSEFTADGIAQETAAKNQLPKSLRNLVKFISGRDFSTAELIDYCARLSSHDVVILSSWASCKETNDENAYSVLPRLRRATRALILGKYDSYLEGGADGGVMTFNTPQGVHAGQVAERILLGERASDIPVTEELRQSQLKYSTLARLGLSMQSVPENITVIDTPNSWFVQRKYEIVAAGSGLVILAIILLSLYLWQKRHSQRLFKLLQERNIAFASISDGVLITDAKGLIVMINPVAEKLTGFTQQEIVGQPHEEIFRMGSFVDGAKTPCPVTKALEERICVELNDQTCLISRDGLRRHIAGGASPIFDASGVLTGCIMILRDVTREHNDRDQLRAMNAQLETGAELTNSSHFRIDMKTREFSGGTRLSALWPIEDGKLKYIEEWAVPEDRAAALKARKTLDETNAVRLTFRSSWSGKLRTYHLLMASENLGDGRRLTIGAIQDITDIMAAKEKLTESQNLWKQVMDSMPLMFFAKNIDTFRYEMVNRAFAEFCGFSSGEEMIGKSDADLKFMPEQIRNKHREINVKITSAASREHLEEKIQDASGRLHSLSTDRQFFSGMDGTRLILCSISDNTELQRNLEDQSIINVCMEKLFAETDSENAVTNVLEKLCTYIGASRAYVLRFDPSSGLGIISAEYFVPGREPLLANLPGIPYSHADKWYLRHLGKEPIMIPDMNAEGIPQLLGERDGIFRRCNAKSVFLAASKTDDVPTGEVGFIFEDVSCPNDKKPLPAFLTASAHLIKIAWERSEAQRNLRDSLAQQLRTNEEKEIAIKNKKVIRACLENLLADDDLPRATEKTMSLVCGHIGAPRCGIFRFNQEKRTTELMFSYSVNGISLVPEKHMRVRESSSGDVSWLARLEKEPFLCFEDITPARIEEFGMSRWADVVRTNTIRSIYVHRIMHEEKVWGCIVLVFENTMRKLTDSELNFLTSIARCTELMLKRQQSQDRIQNALQTARDADKAKSYFIASLSHEIRTPLNAVIGYADLLKDESDVAKKNRYIDSISFAGKALLLLISDLLDLSKLEAGRLPFLYAPCDCISLCEAVIKIFQFRAGQRGNTLQFLHGDMPKLMLDEVRIRQILFNFIGNAVKFTENGQVVLTADFKSSPAGNGCGTLMLQVSDTGIGIQHEDLQKLWEPFVQLSGMRGTNASNSGTGLGLAVVKRLAESMNGSLSASSEVGKGSVFDVTFKEVRIVSETEIPLKDAGIPENGMPWKNQHVLLVDDVMMNLKVTKAICNKLGVESVTGATGGAEALNLLKEERFDLILTDIWMPEMNGVEFAVAVRKLPEYQKIPIIAITADIEAKETFPTDCFDRMVFKPVTHNKLQDILRAVCETGQK